jgi:hypothetical protein
MTILIREREAGRETDVIQGLKRPALSRVPRLAQQGVR